jgi:mRNA interferase RelE/StbE
MANYEFAYNRCCIDFLKTLQKKVRKQIVEKITKLDGDPYPPTTKALQGMSDGDGSVYRIRSGDYRILYVVRGETICILDIDHRKDVYR